MNHREEQSQLRKERILKVAGELFPRLGFRHTSMDLVAQEADVSKGLVYFLFGNKKELFEEVLKQQLQIWMDETARLVQLPAEPLEKIQRSFTAVFEIFRANPMLGAILGDQTAELTRFIPVFKRIHNSWRKYLIKQLEEGKASGQFRQDMDTHRTADIIHTLQQIYLARSLEIVHVPGADERLVEEVGQFIANAVMARQRS